MFERCVFPGGRTILKLLARGSIIKRYEFYLVGAPGWPSNWGHRLSDDLDFYTFFRYPYPVVFLMQKIFQ